MLFKFGFFSLLFFCSLNSFASEETPTEQSAIDSSQGVLVKWKSLAKGSTADPLVVAAKKWKQHTGARAEKITQMDQMIRSLEVDAQAGDSELNTLVAEEKKIKDKLADASKLLQEVCEQKKARQKELEEQKNLLNSNRRAFSQMQVEQKLEEQKLIAAQNILDKTDILRTHLCSIEEAYQATEEDILYTKKIKKTVCKRSSVVAKVIESLNWIQVSLAQDEQEELQNIGILLTSLSTLGESAKSRVQQSSDSLETLNSKLLDLTEQRNAARNNVLQQERAAKVVLDDPAHMGHFLPVVVATAGIGAYYYLYYAN